MRHTLLKVTLLLLIAGCSTSYAQEAKEAILAVSKHHICVGETVTFNDDTRRDDVVGRRWTFPDTVILGEGISEQVTVYRSFYTDTNEITLEVFYTVYDTIVNPENIEDTTFASHIDTTSTKDTVYAFIHPKIRASGDSITCQGDKVNITIAPTLDNCTYLWFPTMTGTASAIVSGATLNVVPYGTEATYYIHIRNDYGCDMWDSTTVYVIKDSLATLPEDGQICIGSPAFLVTGIADHYEWGSFPTDPSLDTVDNSHNSRPTIYPKQNTIYTMTPYGSNGCKGKTMNVSITAYPLPQLQVKLSPRVIDIDDPTMTLTDLSKYSVKSYWMFSPVENAEGATIRHTFEQLKYDSAEVVLQSTNKIGCTVDTTLHIPIQHISSWIPNVFTPNRAENNTFYVKTQCELEYYNLRIYNRRGLLVFESFDQNEQWDGTHNDKDCPQGAYVYIYNYRKAGIGDVRSRKGTVMLIR